MLHTRTEPYPSRPDLLTAALVACLPSINRPKKWMSSGGNLGFQDCLASDHDLTDESARRLVSEYRRYLYLKALHGGVLTPSKRVDQAWHLHTNTLGEDWDRFCETQFGTRIEHRTELSPDESRAAYERTLDLYRQEFGAEPPKDIWPGEAERGRARLAGEMQRLGLGIFLLGIGIGITDYLLSGGSQSISLEIAGEFMLIPLVSEGRILAFSLCIFGFGVGLLGGYVAEGTDLEQMSYA